MNQDQKNQLRYTGSFENFCQKVPPALPKLLDEWLMASGIEKGGTFWIEWVEETNETTDEKASPIKAFRSYDGSGGEHLIVEVRSPWREKPGLWTLKVTIEGADSQELYAAENGAALLQANPNAEGSNVRCRFVLLYEMRRGLDLPLTQLSERWVTSAGFASIASLAGCLRYLEGKGIPVATTDDEEDGPVFRWTEEFDDYMTHLSEKRREELFALGALSITDFVHKLDGNQWGMMEAILNLKTQMMDTGPEIRIPREFCNLIESVVERFVGLAAAAGIVSPVGDNPQGILGKTWRVNMKKYQEAFDFMTATEKDWRARLEEDMNSPSAGVKQIPKPSRDVEIAALIEDLKGKRESCAAVATKYEAEIIATDAAIEEAAYHLAKLKRQRSQYQGRILECGDVARVDRRLKELEHEQAALDSLITDEAKAVLASLEARAKASNIDPSKLTEAFQRMLVTLRPS